MLLNIMLAAGFIQGMRDESKCKWKIERCRIQCGSPFSYEDVLIEDNGSSSRVYSST